MLNGEVLHCATVNDFKSDNFVILSSDYQFITRPWSLEC